MQIAFPPNSARLKRIKAYARSRGWTRFQLAHAAGMSDINGFDRDDWNPTAKTMDRIEAVIPTDFHFAEEEAA